MKSETRSGRGTLWSGGEAVLEDVPYSVTITTRDSGMRHIDGSIDGEFGVLTALVMEDPPPKLVLELDDGRRWECYLSSNSGRLVNRGELK
jgi:hypothetical protein